MITSTPIVRDDSPACPCHFCRDDGELERLELDDSHLTVWVRIRSGQVIRYHWRIKPQPTHSPLKGRSKHHQPGDPLTSIG
jgi:hypothetical protein